MANRGPVDAPKYKDYILPLIFLKRLSDVFDDELAELGPSAEYVDQDHELVRFYVPQQARWGFISQKATGLGEFLTDAVRAVARENPKLSGVIDVKDFNETAAGQREALRIQATRDSLTEVWNRAGILDILRRELARAGREQAPVGVLLADLDHFKRINDTYGHLAGDAALCEAARRMRSSVRVYDAVGRYGGEEFLVLLPGCDARTAWEQAQRLCASIRAEPVHTPEGVITVTLSLGVAAGRGADQMESVLRGADEALYRAKNGGRNRAELAYTDGGSSQGDVRRGDSGGGRTAGA